MEEKEPPYESLRVLGLECLIIVVEVYKNSQEE
jgi:hypothetical protein